MVMPACKGVSGPGERMLNIGYRYLIVLHHPAFITGKQHIVVQYVGERIVIVYEQIHSS